MIRQQVIGSFDSKLSALKSLKPIWVELLCGDRVREAVCIGPGQRRSSSCRGLILKCDSLWSRSWQGIWRAVCRWEGAETPNRHSASLKYHFLCESTKKKKTAGKLGFINRQTHTETSLFFISSHIFIQAFLSHPNTHTHTSPRRQTQSAKTLERPSVLEHSRIFLLLKVWVVSDFLKTTPPSPLISLRIPFTVYTFKVFFNWSHCMQLFWMRPVSVGFRSMLQTQEIIILRRVESREYSSANSLWIQPVLISAACLLLRTAN